ncbi:MAG: hypothetical protein U0V04_20425 [Spirosomataceae bacterium]
MKKIKLLVFLLLTGKLWAQNGVANIEPANLIKDSEERTVTMKNGNLKNTPIVSHWQLHASSFQPTISLGAGGFYMEYAEHPEYSIVTQNAGNVQSASMMAPIDLPHNSEVQVLEACYMDRSGTSNFPDCSLKFNFLRVADNGCPPEVLGTIISLGSGQDPNCPIRCTNLTLAPATINTVNNQDYFYYVLVQSFDDNGANGTANCGNWANANIGIRGIQIQYLQK